MKQENFALLSEYMRSCMGDSAHDAEHVRRVLYQIPSSLILYSRRTE